MKRTLIYLCLLTLVFALSASCAQKRVSVTVNEGESAAVRPIMIHIVNNRIMVDPRAVVLRCPGDQVIWGTTPPNLAFKVKFDKGQGSPFAKDTFDENNYLSGPPTAEVCAKAKQMDQWHPYSVEVEGYPRIDPGIIVWGRE